MKIYLVGGAIRDQLLGLPVKERDWVVVGATPEEMTSLGFRPVGKAFPVFLHPDTHEEYALARTERKVGKGYKGFTFYTDPSVTLEEDLTRRDLTINAIAQDADGTLIDPYDGQTHLKHQLFHHVSDAFAEDPVRILRLARFAAKLPEFTVSDETNKLMQQMVCNGEVDALVAERVWQELERALNETNPNRFFDVLAECDALDKLFPDLSTRPDIAIENLSGMQRFALLLHNQSADHIKSLCKTYSIPNTYRDLALQVALSQASYEHLKNPTADLLFQFIKQTDALRRPERLNDLLSVLYHITRKDYADLIHKTIEAMRTVNIQVLVQSGLKGPALVDAIEKAQKAAIAAVI